MKTFKLSLAAVLATGAISGISAAPLEEAIKDIDVSGWGRYRYDVNRYEVGSVFGGEKDKSASDSFHRFTLDVNFKATLDDNFFSVIGVRYNTRDTSYKAGKNPGIANTHGGLTSVNGTGWGGDGGDSLSVRQYYVGFTGIPDTVILAGRQPLGSYFDYDIVGTGIKVVNNSISGLTLAAFAFDNIEQTDDVTDVKQSLTDNSSILQNNLYGVAAIGSWDWFSAQLWFAHLQNVASLWAVEAGANFGVSDDVSLRGKVQVAGSSLTNKFKDGYRVTDFSDSLVGNSTFIGLNAGISAYGFDADLGYAHYGKKDKRFLNTIQYTGGLVLAGENLLGYTEAGYSGQLGAIGKHNVFYAKAKYTFAQKYWVGLDYVYDKAKGASADTFGGGDAEYKKGQEIVARVGYKYNDKLEFKAWYSWLTKKYEDAYGNSYKNKWNWFRFDAIYTF